MKEYSRRIRALAALAVIVLVLGLASTLPFERLPADARLTRSGREALLMLQDYAQHHVILCLVPAFFIAGAVQCFISKASVMRYLGPRSNKVLAYLVASASGTILAVCSCTILPLFAGIWMRGAGIGPATAFLYSGPAISLLAIILTARILGLELGVARAAGAIGLSVVIGLVMECIYRREERQKAQQAGLAEVDEPGARPLWKNAVYFGALVGLLVFANWGAPLDSSGLWYAVWRIKWVLAALCAILLIVSLRLWFSRSELREWLSSTWFFAKQMLPLLFAGVFIAGFLLGRPGHPALLPSEWVAVSVGGNGLGANLAAALFGAFMYFATLMEVPILQGLIGAGMGKGPALTMLLADPALSLPSMLVLRAVFGTRKTIVYVALVVVFSVLAGLSFGNL